jgi:hypothetical protein
MNKNSMEALKKAAADGNEFAKELLRRKGDAENPQKPESGIGTPNPEYEQDYQHPKDNLPF